MKKPGIFRYQALRLPPALLRLGGRWERPGGLRVQSGLSSRSGSRGYLGSRAFRGFLRSRLLGCFLGGWLLGSGLFGGCFFGRGFFGRGFFSGCFFSWCCFFGRGFFSCYFFGRSLFSCYFFGRSLLRGSGLFCGRFFCSCHFNILLDQVTKSTSCWLECMKRFKVLGQCPAP